MRGWLMLLGFPPLLLVLFLSACGGDQEEGELGGILSIEVEAGTDIGTILERHNLEIREHVRDGIYLINVATKREVEQVIAALDQEPGVRIVLKCCIAKLDGNVATQCPCFEEEGEK